MHVSLCCVYANERAHFQCNSGHAERLPHAWWCPREHPYAHPRFCFHLQACHPRHHPPRRVWLEALLSTHEKEAAAEKCQHRAPYGFEVDGNLLRAGRLGGIA